MTISEFKAWFDGYTSQVRGQPTAKQWRMIKAKLALVRENTSTPVQMPTFTYYPQPLSTTSTPTYPYYSLPNSTTLLSGLGSSVGQSGHGGSNGGGSNEYATIKIDDFGFVSVS